MRNIHFSVVLEPNVATAKNVNAPPPDLHRKWAYEGINPPGPRGLGGGNQDHVFGGRRLL